ncbi:MAG TPA: ABC transporter substrate-binding protein [Methylomirabilota bacterium]|nr:ABC transporter substrate-binding protein [Methylomirabilota bacterium]
MDDASADRAAGTLDRRRFLALAAGAVAGSAAPRRAGALERPIRGGVLKQIGVDPPTFDVHATASEQTQLVSSLVRRTLFKVVCGARHAPSDFTLAPDLALRTVMSADGRTHTITLRPGVRWESRPPVNGRELVAADVKYSLERALRKSPYAALLGPVERIDAPDRRTVRVHLADSFGPFVQNLAAPWTAILPPEVEDRLGDLKAAESLVGCGPFVLERYEPGVKVVFSRNPTYHARGLPHLDKVEWLFIKDRPTQLALFRAGQVDLPDHDARIPRTEVAALRNTNPAYPLVSWDGLAVRSLAMRTDRPPFNDVRVRRALSLAVDRKTWVAEHLVDGDGAQAHGPVPGAMRPWNLAAPQLGEGARYLEHDPATARTLLAEAGFLTGLKVKCTSWPGHGPEYVEDLERLAGHLRRAGVELQIVNEDYGPYIRGSFLGRFDEASWGPSSIFTDVDGYLSGSFRTGQAGNRSHVADPQLDAMLDAQRRVRSSSSRKRIIDEIQRRAAMQVFYVYTPYARNVSSWVPRVRNYGPKNSFDRGAQLEVVWLDPA